MDFSSDSENSSSSSDSEKPKIICDTKEEEPEIPAQIILDEAVLKILIQQIESIASSYSIYEPLKFQDQIKNFIIDRNADSLFIPHENSYAETYSSKDLPFDLTKFTYFIKKFPCNEFNEFNFFTNILFGSVDTNFDYLVYLIFKYNYACIIYRMDQLPGRIKFQLCRTFEKFFFRLAKVVFMTNGLSDLYLPILAMIYQQGTFALEIKIDDILTLYEDAVVSWCDQLSSVINDEEINHQFPYNFNLTNVLRFWQCERHNLQQMRKCLNDSRWQLVLKTLKNYNSAHLDSIRRYLKILQLKEADVKSTNQFLLVLQQFAQKLDQTSTPKIPLLLPELWLLIYVICEESNYHRVLQNKELLINSIIQQIIDMCLVKIEMKDIQSESTEECMNNLIECVRMCCLLKETFVQNQMFSPSEKSMLLQMINRIDVFIQRCVGALELCSRINIFFILSHTQKELQFKIEHYVKIKTVMQDICESFFSSAKNCQLTGHDFLGLCNISWFDVNYKFLCQTRIIDNQITELVENIFHYVSTSDDAIDSLRVTYQFSKLPSLHFFFVQKQNQAVDLISREINEIDESLLGNKMNSVGLNSNARLKNRCIFSFRCKRRVQFLFQTLKRCKWFTSNAVNENCKKNYQESIREINTYLTNEYKIWLGKYEHKILKGLNRPLLTKCSNTDGLLEVNVHRRLLRVIQDACYWIQMGFNLLANVSKAVSIVPQFMSLYAKVETFVLAYNRIFNGQYLPIHCHIERMILEVSNYAALTPDEHTLFFTVIRHCKDISRPMMSNVEWHQDNAGRIVKESLKQIQQIENLVHTFKRYNTDIINNCKNVCFLICAEIQQNELAKIVDEFKTARLLFFQKLVRFYNQMCDCIQSVLISFRGYIHKHEMKIMWMLYLKQIDSLVEEAFKGCLKNNLSNFIDHVSNSYESSKCLMKIRLTVEIADNTIYFTPTCQEIFNFFSGLGFRICEVFKIFPRISNKFSLVKSAKIPSYASTLIKDPQIKELQNKLETAIADNLEKLRKFIETWNQYGVVWSKVNVNLEEKFEKQTNVHLCEILFKSYFSILEEIQSKRNVENEILFEIDVVKLKFEIISQSENRIRHLLHIIQKHVETLLQKIKTGITADCAKLNEFDFNNGDYKTFMNLIFKRKLEYEMKIGEVHQYATLLRHFNLNISPASEKMQVILEQKWKTYTNIIDRYRFKIQIIHNEDTYMTND